MKIISIKKRWFTLSSLTEWRVGVEHEDGKVKYYDCWAGADNPTAENLLWDLKKRLGDKPKPESLIGKTI